MAKIRISDVNKKHIRIVCFLVVSAGLAYVLSIVTAKPEAIYLTPIINYILYAIKTELDKEGYIEVLRK